MDVKRWLAAAGVAMCVMGAPQVWAQDTATPELSERKAGDAAQLADQINNEIFSPFCPGKTLDMCPSPNAATVRRDIQKMSREGYSREQIKAKVLDTYGEEFRIVEPPASDNNALFAALFVGLLLAVGVVFALSKRGTKPAQSDDAPDTEDFGDEGDDDYLNELRDELEQ